MLQAVLGDTAAGGTNKCRLPEGAGSCNPTPVCPGSEVSFDMGDRTPTFTAPGTKRGTITVFMTSTGDVVVTATTTCNCFLYASGSNGNSIFLGSNYDPANTTAPASLCPSRLSGMTDVTDTASLAAVPSMLTCMSWVLPKARVQAAMAGSSVPGTIALTMHFAVSCYSACGTLSLNSQTNVISSGVPADIRCEIQPLRGVAYRVPAACLASPPPPAPAPPPLPPPAPAPGPPPPAPNPAPPPPAPAPGPPPPLVDLSSPLLQPEGEHGIVMRVAGVVLDEPYEFEQTAPLPVVYYQDPEHEGMFFPAVPDPTDPNMPTPGDPKSSEPPTFDIVQQPDGAQALQPRDARARLLGTRCRVAAAPGLNTQVPACCSAANQPFTQALHHRPFPAGSFTLEAIAALSMFRPPPPPPPPTPPPPRPPPPAPKPPKARPSPPPYPPPQVSQECLDGAGGWVDHCENCSGGTASCLKASSTCSAIQVRSRPLPMVLHTGPAAAPWRPGVRPRR